MSGWFLRATEEQKDQALRNADSAHVVDVNDDPTFDPRTEDMQIENKYIGFLGELVVCNKFNWIRHFPPGHDTFIHGYTDATDKDGQNIEIKTRRAFYPNHSKDMMVLQVEECDLAVLLFLWEEEGSGESYVVVVKWFNRSFLSTRSWNMWISRSIWKQNLREREVPKRFL